MAYNLDLDYRVKRLTREWGVSSKKMFGGIGYFAGNGNMCFGIMGAGLLLRVNETLAAELLQRPGIETAQMGQRVMKSWLLATGDAIKNEAAVSELLVLSYDFVLTLPAK